MKKLQDAAKQLIDWFLANKRDLPFRQSKNPYHIWISEIMAQQTQIQQMLPYYEKWLKRYPSISALADAPLDDILKSWQGLGYYNRARNIHQAAQLLVKENNGQFYDNYQQIKTLPGIGDYTASAISSIAFKERQVVIDGNVKRVMSRLLTINSTFSKTKDINELKNILFTMSEKVDIANFNEAMMELGALICSPTKPDCASCPLADFCQAYQSDTIRKYPPIVTKKAIPTLKYHVYICLKEKHVLVSHDDSDGLMKDYLRLPMASEKDENFLDTSYLKHKKHTFSHKKWDMICYLSHDYIGNNAHYQWLTIEKALKLAWISAHYELLTQITQTI